MTPFGPTRVRLIAQSSTKITAVLGVRSSAMLLTFHSTNGVDAIDGPAMSMIVRPSSQNVRCLLLF